jgi:two-component system chemotaxis response regulator CheB
VIKLLIADDSALMRKVLDGIFREAGDFEVRLARDGMEALELVHSFSPDVVTLDVQMPGLDGLGCLERIMLEAPRPVVMVSAATGSGADATLKAMTLGAVDFVAKPSGTVSLEVERLRDLLVEKVRDAASARIRPTLRLAERVRRRFREAGLPEGGSLPEASRSATAAPGLVLIGTSTGGPAALDIVLPQLPADLPWPVLVAQHMPAFFTAAFANRLDRQCQQRVVEVARPVPLQAGTIYIARGDADIVVAPRPTGPIALSVPVQRDYPWHPSVERMVASALDHFDAKRLVGVLMTGMGDDGAKAMARLRAKGGQTIAEAESTATIWGMPRELVRLGGAQRVLPVEEIAEAILAMVGSHASR